MDREDINRMTGFVHWFLGSLVATLPAVMVFGLIIGNFGHGFFYLLVLGLAVVLAVVAFLQPQTQRVPFDQLAVEERRQVLDKYWSGWRSQMAPPPAQVVRDWEK